MWHVVFLSSKSKSSSSEMSRISLVLTPSEIVIGFVVKIMHTL